MANEVVINVTADTKKAGKGLDGIRDKMKKVGMGATAAGGLITAFAAKSLQQFSSIGDEVHKMSLRTGFSTKALSELRVAADLSGTSLKGMETGVRKMQRTIVDAQDGVLLAVDNLDKLGITLDDLKGQSPETQFQILTEALAGLETQEEKVAVAMNVFGKAGTELLPMLASGKEGLIAMRQQAHDLGLVFDQEAAEKAAKLTDAMSTMKGSMTGVMLTVAEKLAPIITDLAIFIEKTVSKVTAWTEANPKLTGVIVKVVAAIGALMLVVGPLMIAFGAITTIAPFVAGAFAIMTGPIGIILLAVTALGLAWATNFGGIRDKTKDVFDFLSRIYQSKLGWLLPGGSLIKGLFFLKDNWKEIWESIVSVFRRTINNLIEGINVFIRAWNKVADVIGRDKIAELPTLGVGGTEPTKDPSEDVRFQPKTSIADEPAVTPVGGGTAVGGGTIANVITAAVVDSAAGVRTTLDNIFGKTDWEATAKKFQQTRDLERYREELFQSILNLEGQRAMFDRSQSPLVATSPSAYQVGGQLHTWVGPAQSGDPNAPEGSGVIELSIDGKTIGKVMNGPTGSNVLENQEMNAGTA